jgi:hypothetical protein
MHPTCLPASPQNGRVVVARPAHGSTDSREGPTVLGADFRRRDSRVGTPGCWTIRAGIAVEYFSRAESAGRFPPQVTTNATCTTAFRKPRAFARLDDDHASSTSSPPLPLHPDRAVLDQLLHGPPDGLQIGSSASAICSPRWPGFAFGWPLENSIDRRLHRSTQIPATRPWPPRTGNYPRFPSHRGSANDGCGPAWWQECDTFADRSWPVLACPGRSASRPSRPERPGLARTHNSGQRVSAWSQLPAECRGSIRRPLHTTNETRPSTAAADRVRLRAADVPSM